MKLFDDEQMTDDQLGLVIDIDARFQLESWEGKGEGGGGGGCRCWVTVKASDIISRNSFISKYCTMLIKTTGEIPSGAFCQSVATREPTKPSQEQGEKAHLMIRMLEMIRVEECTEATRWNCSQNNGRLKSHPPPTLATYLPPPGHLQRPENVIKLLWNCFENNQLTGNSGKMIRADMTSPWNRSENSRKLRWTVLGNHRKPLRKDSINKPRKIRQIIPAATKHPERKIASIMELIWWDSTWIDWNFPPPPPA